MRSDAVQCLLLAGLMLTAMLLELTAGTIGWVLPLAPAVFYFLTLNTSWHTASLAALAVGAVPDLALGRTFPVTPLALLALTLASYGLRRRPLSELPDAAASAVGAVAACEAVYMLYADEYSLAACSQYLSLTLTGTALALLLTAAGRALQKKLGLPDPFVPRSTLWKKRRLQNPRPRSDQP